MIMSASSAFGELDDALRLHGPQRQQHHRWSPLKQLEFISMANQLQSLLPACISILRGVGITSISDRSTGVASSSTEPAEQIFVQHLDEVSDHLALVTSLVVLETIAKNKDGVDVIQQKCSVFGDQSTLEQIAQSAGLSFTPQSRPRTCSELWTLMISTSYVQVQAARNTCVAALNSALGTCNCFKMLQIAQACCVGSLHQAASDFIMQHFSKAIVDDVEGLNALDRKTLESLLTSDALQASEVDVFRVLMVWSQAQVQRRSKQRSATSSPSSDSDVNSSKKVTFTDVAVAMPTSSEQQSASMKPDKETMQVLGQEFVSMCQACVRPGLMSIEQLEHLDGDQEVADNEWALSLVARWYLGHVMGHGFNQHASWNRPRKPVTSSQQQFCQNKSGLEARDV